MPRVCSVCSHPDRAEIDRAALAGTSYRAITRQYGIGKDAVLRHKADHLLAELVKAQEVKELADAETLVGEAKRYKARVAGIMDAAETGGDYKVAISAANSIRGYLDLLAKLAGLIDSRPQVNLVLAPEWLATRAALLAALEPYVEARVAVATALLALEGEQEEAHNGHNDRG
jgi:hypothetical protein